MKHPLIFAFAITIFTQSLAAETISQPNPTLTPGAIKDTDINIICTPGYAKSHRVWHNKLDTLKKYGYSPSNASSFEDDDLVPICLGGDNANPLNHWPQPCAQWNGPSCTAGEAAEKDRKLEWKMCSEVCASMSQDALNKAQNFFLSGKWIQEMQ